MATRISGTAAEARTRLGDGSPSAGSIHAPRLTVDLDALEANWRTLAGRAPGAETAAVVKADAYGLGLGPVSSRLHEAGCRTFFVAQLEEGLRLRCVPNLEEARIYVLSGLAPGDEVFYRDNGLEPVLNTLAEAEAWSRFAKDTGTPLPAALQVESGMNRLGMPAQELECYLAEPAIRDGIALSLVMSHLACADAPDHPQNAAQKARFESLCARFPGVPASLANSGGVFLGPDYAFDMTRPGIALYGGAPNPSADGHLAQVVSLEARVLQVREIGAGETVGYGATFRADRPTRIATLSAGYADGLLRSAAEGGIAYFAGVPAPLAGRVSMDSVGVDITDLPAGSVRAGDWAELLGPHQSVDALAGAAGTIAYEILTGLGRRAFTQYNGSRPGADGA